jgi:hypothetical protein
MGKKPLSTIISHYDPSSDESSDKHEESQEDLATYSILTNFTRLLSPLETPASEVPSQYGRNASPDVGSLTSTKVTKTKEYATRQEPEPARRAMPLPSIPARRGSDQVVQRVAVPQVEVPRTESPVPRVASPVPKGAPSASTRPDVSSTNAMMSTAGYGRKAVTISSEETSRAKSPVPQGVGMSVQEQIIALPPSTTSTQQQTAGRARSPVPMVAPVTGSLRSKNGPAHLKDTEDEQASQRSRGSRDDSGYLPVAQLRPPMSRQGTSQSVSQSGHGKQGNKRGGSSDSGVQMKERERERERERSPEPDIPSPPATTRVQKKIMARHPPLKDLDSPLPPPPMQVESAPADITSFQQKQSREIPSQRHLVSSPTEIRSSPERARKHHTAPPTLAVAAIPSPTLTTHSRPEEEYRGRSNSPTPSLRDTLPKRSHSSAQRYPPPVLDGSFDEYAIPTRDQLQRAAAVCVVAQNGIRVPFGEVIRERKTIVIFIRHFWSVLHELLESFARY